MVKLKFKHLKLTFVIAGCIIGSGFITGSELVRFFGISGFIPTAYAACIIMYFFAYLLMDIGRKYGNLNNVNQCIFKKYASIANFFCIMPFAVIAAGMLSGLDILFNQTVGLPSYFCIFSIICLALAKMVAGRGLDALGKISAVLVPITVVFITALILFKGQFNYQSTPQSQVFKTLILAAFYPSMNMFLSAPVLLGNGAKYKYGLKISAAAAALSLFFCIVLILSAICFEGADILNFHMPLLAVTGRGGFVGIIFSCLIFLTMFSSLSSCYFPLSLAIKQSRKPKLFDVLLLVSIFLLSRVGMGGIVKYFYPILGAFGAIYLLILAVFNYKNTKILFFMSKKRSAVAADKR